MNILEEEDFIKGLPDSVLMEEAQRPTGTLTQYVVMSEIQRRSKMRKEHEAQLAQGPQSTVKDQIIQEGIMSSMPPQMAMAPQMAQRMPNMPPQGIQQAMPPEMMSGGGVARMFTGGETAPDAIIRNVLAQNPDATMVDFLQAGLTEEQAKAYAIDFAERQLDILEDPSLLITDEERALNIEDARNQRFDQASQRAKRLQAQADENARLRSLITDEDRARNQADIREQRKDQFLDNMYGFFGDAYEGATGLVGSGIDSLARSRYGKTLALIPDLIFGDDSAESIQDQNKRLGLGPSGSSGFLMRKDPDLDVSKSGIATANPTKDEAGGVNTAGDGKEVQSDSVFSTDDYRSRLEYLMNLGVDSDKVEIPTLDFSDIRDDLNRRIQSNMLLQLGAGIAGGDVSKGIQAAGEVSQAGGRDISKIDLAERQGQFEAARAAQKRQDDLLKTQRMLGAELMGLDAKLKVSRDTDRREIIRYYAGIRDGLQDQLVALTEYGETLPKASQDLMNRIDKMLQNLSSKYGIVLPAEAKGVADNNPAELGGSLDLNLPSRQTAP